MVVTAGAGITDTLVARMLMPAAIVLVIAIAGTLIRVVLAGGANDAEDGVHGFVELPLGKRSRIGGQTHLGHAGGGQNRALKAQRVA